MRRITTLSARETEAAGEAFALRLAPGDVVAVSGTLGSGKTRFIVGVCRGLGVTVNVSSPTFTLINEYPAPFGVVAHADLYRISSGAELVEIGLHEYFREGCITFIEWPDRAADLLPPGSIAVECEHGAADGERIISLPEEVR